MSRSSDSRSSSSAKEGSRSGSSVRKNSLKLGLIGDPHFMVDNVLIMKKFIQCVVEWIIENDFDAVICLGDVLHQHERIHMTPFMLALEFFQKMRELVPTYVIIGNHDRHNNLDYRSTEHPFVACKEWSNITIVDRGAVFDIKGFKLAMVPYVPRGRFREAYGEILEEASIEASEIDVVFAHQEFRGCKMGLLSSTDGDVWTKKDPRCYSGHIHLRHELHEANVYYVGTPLQHDHSEVETKGLHTLEIGGKHGKPTFEIRFDELPLPKKITIRIEAHEFDAFKLPKGQVKLIVIGETYEIQAIKRSERYQKLKKRCRIHFLPTQKEKAKPVAPGTSFLDLVYADLKKPERKYLRKLLEHTLPEPGGNFNEKKVEP